MSVKQNDRYLGIGLAILATIIWSGNFVVARGVSQHIGPVRLAFYRWLTATVIMAPLAWKQFRAESGYILQYKKYVFWAALTGVALFNTCVYIAGHYTSAINLALIGTTSSPIFSTIMAVVFLKERMTPARIIGFACCIAGVLLLLSNGRWEILASFRFSKGDLWVIAGAVAFAVYSVLVKKKPQQISTISFLFAVFLSGTVMLLPFFVWESLAGQVTQWDAKLIGIILYLGAGASVISFLCWNTAIQKLGAATTVLFGNLIPVFSVWEAVLLLGEKVSTIHLVSGVLVIGGLIIANTSFRLKTAT
ncbi:DMT family transporter [Sediminibacterium soli]|uniref:DMT family transporter n=1 Tax=Sediminibacterium soli TaxID=2698829 RepID=UPI00137AFCC3|nr:DMT family transporter [Sediminibacterium soli]NCI46037.1 DMT family transporter [Sediminibacterium soli]